MKASHLIAGAVLALTAAAVVPPSAEAFPAFNPAPAVNTGDTVIQIRDRDRDNRYRNWRGRNSNQRWYGYRYSYPRYQQSWRYSAPYRPYAYAPYNYQRRPGFSLYLGF